MRKLIVHEFISLDGVIQAPGGPVEDTEGGFPYGGWTHPYWHDEIGSHFGQAMNTFCMFIHLCLVSESAYFPRASGLT